ncbi:MAG TPA: hypothetical protein VFK35_06280 [Candidatus Limnocylindrales bacterium]|nr:hypothetical protein [Candidatus Limnocylindrales bacterium]
MTTDNLFRAAAAGGIAVGLTGAWLLWTRRNRRSAIIASAFGLYAIAGIASLPLVGLQAWFAILLAMGPLALVLSRASLVATWHQPGS